MNGLNKGKKHSDNKFHAEDSLNEGKKLANEVYKEGVNKACETRLAGLSVYPFLLNVCAIFVVLMSTWFSCMLLTGYIFFVFLGSVVWSIGMVLFINIALLLGLLKYLSSNLKKMNFEQTRKYFSQKNETVDEKLEKKINC